MLLNKWERKLYRFRAKIYMHLPRNSKLRKLRFALLVLCGLCFFLRWAPTPTAGERQKQETDKQTDVKLQEKKDEQTDFFVQFVSGSRMLLEKEETEEKEEAEIITVTPVPTEIARNEQVIQTAGGVYAAVFNPECYPELSEIVGTRYLMNNLLDLTYLKENFYIVNATTEMTERAFDVAYFLQADLSLEKKQEPQILIYHTHASEAFSDSRSGVAEDTVVGMGERLAEILEQKYGYAVLHDTTVFDRKNGKDNRDNAYSEALVYIERILKEYPSIEVIIDLHRDAGAKRVVTLQGKQVAKVMLFNGLSRTKEKELTYLPNPNLKDNLAFSFQMKLIGDEMYPGLMNRIFLKDYRYNMHLRGRYLLIELGTQNNTVDEARNAMEPLADVLAQVLSK